MINKFSLTVPLVRNCIENTRDNIHSDVGVEKQVHHNIKVPTGGSKMQSETHFCLNNPKEKNNLQCVEDIWTQSTNMDFMRENMEII